MSQGKAAEERKLRVPLRYRLETGYRGGRVVVAMRCAYFALLSGSSIGFSISSHHSRMGAWRPRLRAAEEDWASSTSALPLPRYNVANVCSSG